MFINILFNCETLVIKIKDYNEKLVRKHNANWFPLNDFPDLIFDHNIMVDKALKRLRRKAQSQPIGFELLPDKFTIPQVQNLYEAIFQKNFDKRNFRKKILSFDVLKKFNEKEKMKSKKGAFLYQFNRDKYNDLIDSGYSFEFNV